MIFIVRVSDSERLSNSHKIFINVKILDSLKISDYGNNGKWKQCDGDSADDSRGIPDCSTLNVPPISLSNVPGISE